MSQQIRLFFLAVAVALLLAGCVVTQIYPTVQESNVSLRPGDLEAHGIAFITPSAATSEEEVKQAIALIFAKTLRDGRNNVRVLTLAETLGAIDQAGLADAYKRMYEDYVDTGLFKGDILKQIGTATETRYIAQIKV